MNDLIIIVSALLSLIIFCPHPSIRQRMFHHFKKLLNFRWRLTTCVWTMCFTCYFLNVSIPSGTTFLKNWNGNNIYDYTRANWVGWTNSWKVYFEISVYFVVIRSIGDSSQKQIITNEINYNERMFSYLMYFSALTANLRLVGAKLMTIWM